MGLGVDGQPMVYLDVSHLDPHMLERRVGGVLEIYEKFVGEDPKKVPMKIFPGMHYSMGGLWVDYSHMTNVPGLFAAGEVDHQYHGANRLGANSLLSCLYSGIVGGPAMVRYARAHDGDDAGPLLEEERTRQADVYERVMRMDGPENAYALAREMGEWMTANVTVVRDNRKLQETDVTLLALRDRWGRIGLSDRGRWANHEVSFVKQLWNMLELARVITLGALRRNESRGAHYKPEFPNRDDAHWLKTTKARWTSDGPQFTYDPVDVSLLHPRPRKYDAVADAGGQGGR
jgi:succinate dehydrogenase / fumarate reductase flavoprotein subunit